MKIDSDLRAAIHAAAKSQPALSWSAQSDAIQKSVDAFLKQKPALNRQTKVLIGQIQALQNQRAKLCEKLETLLNPFGLQRNDTTITASFRHDLEGQAARQFKAAGGVMPPLSKRKWTAAAVIAELAAAEPKQLTRILKKYGINWS